MRHTSCRELNSRPTTTSPGTTIFTNGGLTRAIPRSTRTAAGRPSLGRSRLAAYAQSGKYDVNDLVKAVGGIEQRNYRHRCVEAWSMVIPWDGFALAKLVAVAEPKPEAKYLQFT